MTPSEILRLQVPESLVSIPLEALCSSCVGEGARQITPTLRRWCESCDGRGTILTPAGAAIVALVARYAPDGGS